MAVTFTFANKIPGIQTGGKFGTSMSRITGQGAGETVAGAPAVVTNTIVVGCPFFSGGFPEYVQPCQVFGTPPIFNGLPNIHAPDSVLGDGFGAAVDLSGTSMIVNGGSGTKVYVFVLTAGAWFLQQEFSTSDLLTGAVTIDGDTAVVGAGAFNANAGAAYVFTRAGGVWTQIQRLIPGDLSPGDFFGNDVLLLGANLFVSTTAQAGNSGAVYWYQLSGGVWTLKQKIAGPVPGEVFSTGVAFDGVTLVVGAAGAAGGTGHAYVYTIVGGLFALFATLIGSDTAANDQFGSSTAVKDNLIVVGARNNLVHGAVYVFQNLVQAQKLVQSDPTGVDQFGTEVELYSGSIPWIAVGASGAGAGALGAAYFFSGPVTLTPLTAQLAFMGVRRMKGTDPLAPTFKFKPKPYIYNAQIALTFPATDPLGNPPPLQTLSVQIKDYDFELYELRLRYRSAAGVFQDPTVPLAKLMIYDPVTQQISNAPILDIYVNGLPLSKYKNGAVVPPLLYPRNSAVRIDFLSVVKTAGILPLTCFVDLVGVQRQPCA